MVHEKRSEEGVVSYSGSVRFCIDGILPIAGTDKAGCIWVDNEFGLSHLAYIGTDGYKYLAGAGNYPY